jgi:glycosyltransferase involved in cell wall biosynthesis
MREAFPGQVLHVNAKWSDSLEDIGGIGFRKIGRIFRFLWSAAKARYRDGAEVLYYVPGPVKLSAVVRDFIILSILRPLFPETIFHWHAIGQGEWAHGSERVMLLGGGFFDAVMRRLCSFSLAAPDLSIVVSPLSDKDARAVSSKTTIVVPNGIVDPVGTEYPERGSGKKPKRLLFFSRGTEEKGILDALKAVAICGRECSFSKNEYILTLAGGVDTELESRIAALVRECEVVGVAVERRDFLTGQEKEDLFRTNDLLLFPSHWESFGLVVIEAMAFQLPVVATNSDGVMGILGQDYPYMAPIKSPKQLAEVLERGLRDGFEGAFGRDHFLDLYEIKVHEAALIEAFESLMRPSC